MSTMKKIAQLLALSLAAAYWNMDNMFISEREKDGKKWILP